MPQSGQKTIIAPSLLSADLLNLQTEIDLITKAGADWLHLDIMDGHFVPNLTFGPEFVRQIKKISQLPIDVHLMISPADPFIDAFAKAGANYITIHPEADFHPHRTLQKIKSHGVKAGIALSPGTPIETVYPLLETIDLILIMTVNPGFSGQKFIAHPLEKLKALRKLIDTHKYPILLEVDGGVDKTTAKEITCAGADVLVTGQYVFSKDMPVSSDVYKSRIEDLRKQ